MPEEELHYPPGAEPEKPADPAPEALKDENPDEAPAPEPKPDEKPEDKKPDPAPETPVKKRSIFEDYKDKKQEAKDWKQTAIVALEAQGIELKGNETPEQLQALIKEHKTPTPPKPDAPSPEAPSQPEKPLSEVEQYAKDQGLDPAAISQLVEIVKKQLPKSELSEEDREAVADFRTWREKQARIEEDQAIESQAPAVKVLAKELGFEISRDEDATAIMNEVKRLAHTAEFHDKPVDYIVFTKRAELAKMVSPKRGSFERGGDNNAEGKEEPVDFSAGTGITPAQSQKAIEGGRQAPGYEIRRS